MIYLHRRTDTFGLRTWRGVGGWPYPKNLHSARMRECWNRDANAFKMTENKNVHKDSYIETLLKYLFQQS